MVGSQAAEAAVEMALWDLQGKALGRPLCDLIGGRARPVLEEVVALGWGEPAALAADSRAMKAEGVRIFKVKVGDTPERDEQRVAAVREAVGPQAHITVDANQGWWDAKTAVRAINLLEHHRIEFAEQPVRMDDLEAARFVRAHVSVPIALDEERAGSAGGSGVRQGRRLRHVRGQAHEDGWHPERAQGQRDRRGRRYRGHGGQHGREFGRHVGALPREHRACQRRARRRRVALAAGRPGARHRARHQAKSGRRHLGDRRPGRSLGLGVELIEENVERQRVERRW